MMRKVNRREVKSINQANVASKLQNWDLNAGLKLRLVVQVISCFIIKS